MKFSFVILAMVIVFIGCGDKYYNNRIQDSNDDKYLPLIESEPSLSPDRNYIYYITVDTADNLNSGIYRAAVANPIRQKLMTGIDIHSPSLGFDNNTVAYLDDSGKIYYYNLDGQTTDTSTVDEHFESIFYISDNKLLAHRGDTGGQNDSIFLIDNTGQVTYLVDGWDPTYYAKDTFIYIYSGDDSSYCILRNNIISYSQPETLFTISSFPAIPRWPSMDRQLNRLTYCLFWADQRFIYSAKAYETGFNFVDSSDYPKPLILGNDLIIYTGWNGRLYKSDFLGTQFELFTKP